MGRAGFAALVFADFVLFICGSSRCYSFSAFRRRKVTVSERGLIALREGPDRQLPKRLTENVTVRQSPCRGMYRQFARLWGWSVVDLLPEFMGSITFNRNSSGFWYAESGEL